MTIELPIILLLPTLHFISDFVFQSNYVAQNKSKSNKILLKHVSIYSILFIIAISPLYGILNGFIHFCIDYVTSRITSKLWNSKQTHWFFITIGFDQLLHILTLYITYYFIMI